MQPRSQPAHLIACLVQAKTVNSRAVRHTMSNSASTHGAQSVEGLMPTKKASQYMGPVCKHPSPTAQCRAY
jgi:hypothetical protein